MMLFQGFDISKLNLYGMDDKDRGPIPNYSRSPKVGNLIIVASFLKSNV